MFGFLGSLLSGGVTGLLGVAIQRIADYKNKQLDLELSRQKFENDLALKKVDSEIMAQEWASRTKVAQVEEQGVEQAADAKAFSASFNEPVRYSDGPKSNAQGWLLVILDTIRGLVRPCLTVYLCILTTLIYREARDLLDGTSLTPSEALELTQLVIRTILYLTTTCVLWWFGTRNKGKQPG